MKRGKKISERDKKFLGNFFILLRYLILFVLMFTLPIIYFLFTPLTLFPAIYLLKIFFNNISLSWNLIQNTEIIMINLKTFVQIIPACIAGSAYLLLLILNLTVSMSIKKRILSILLSFLMLLILNILRIFSFAILYYYNFSFFDFTHIIFWYFLSTIFVILIWLSIAKIFSIREIPIYSDITPLIKRD